MTTIGTSLLLKRGLLAWTALLAAGPSAQAESPRSAAVEIVEYGEYEPRADAAKRRAPDTSRGYVQAVEATHDPVLLHWTEVVDGQLGGRFGIKILVHGAPSFETVPLRVRVLHPPFRNPGSGQVSDSEEWDADVNIGIPRFTGWSFDAPWEIVAGEWRMQVLDGDEVVAEQAFEVVATDSSADAAALPEWRPEDALAHIPDELWQRATVILSGRYGEGRSACIWVSEDERRWYQLQGFEVTRRYLGKVRSPYVGVGLVTPSPTPYACADCLVEGREYLLLLRLRSASMEFLRTGEGAYSPYNVVDGEEILAIVEIPAGRRLRVGRARQAALHR